MDYKKYIKTIKDFPKKNVNFRDITSFMEEGLAYSIAISELTEYVKKKNPNKIVSPESRGFMFGCPIATNLKISFVPVRKPNKLPRETIKTKSVFEYGENILEIHKDAIHKGDKVLIVDDLLATGGTIKSCIKLIEELGGEVVGLAFLIELVDLKGKEILKNYDIKSLVSYFEDEI